ncbi:MAG: hypothetical protein SOI38_00585 [Eggerthellaceae bacterium]|jgi:hypothetical protein
MDAVAETGLNAMWAIGDAAWLPSRGSRYNCRGNQRNAADQPRERTTISTSVEFADYAGDIIRALGSGGVLFITKAQGHVNTMDIG